MKDNNPKELFDKAYTNLRAGRIKEAAACFQSIIKNSRSFGPYAGRIAQQRILWYCVPLNVIFAELEQNKFPIDVHSIITSLLRSDDRYNESDIEPILKSIEDYLAKMSVCIRVGKYFWIYRIVLEKLAGRVRLDLENAVVPISLEAIYRKEWPDYCRDHTTFPDHYSEIALAEVLQNLNVKVLASKLVVSENLLPNAMGAFAQMIGDAAQPLCLKDQITRLFPGLSESPEAISLFENYLALHLDNRFIEYIPGYYLTRKLIPFNTISFDDLFSNELLPFPSIQLLRQYFPNPDPTDLTTDIITLVQSQLLSNPNLVQIGEGFWISRSRFDSIHRHVMKILSDQCGAISLDYLLTQVAPPDMRMNQLNQFQAMILVSLHSDNQAIQITKAHWLHEGNISNLLDKAYFYLLEVSQSPLDKIVLAVLSDIELPNPLPTFHVTFEDYLCEDPRFLLIPNNQKVWRAIPKGQRDNNTIYKFLSELNFPLIEYEIIEKLQLKEPEYDLAADSRFQSFPNNLWGLSSWVWLNDYVYEYLLSTGQALHETVVVGLVCKKFGIRRKSVFFLPEGDPRFAQDSLNRWFCLYKLKPTDLDSLLGELGQYAGVGRKLDILFHKVLGLHPDATNASEVLPSDPRFIHLDNLWYSHRKAFREMSSSDVERIYNYLSALPVDSPAISIKDIGINALGWDGRLTNAPNLLAQDDRFVEIYLDFWILSTWSSPDYDRSSVGRVAVFKSKSVTESEDDPAIELPKTLTKRGPRGGTQTSSDLELKKYYHTLSYLDILHGNLRVSGLLKKWIPKTAKTVLVVDDESNELVAYVDETHAIINIRDWIERRELTYGDKIYIQPGRQPASLYIRLYGERDQNVYHEALQHQDIEKLIEEARRVNMTYRDLIIEVMKAFDIPLHREDIFQLVDYQRTATRNTIFEFLSLTDCPYEELRYFVPQGKGYWSFDRKRKKAFDMKMKELLDENASLKGQIAILSEHKESEQDITDRVSLLKEKVQYLEQSVQALNTEKTSLLTRIQTLEAEKDLGDQLIHQLNDNFAQAQQNLNELSDAHSSTIIELERMRLEQQTFQEKETHIQTFQAELERLRFGRKELQNKDSQLAALHAELSQSHHILVQTRTESGLQVAALQDQIAGINSELDALRYQLEQAKAAHAASDTQVADLIACRDQLQAKLETHRAQAQNAITTLQNQLTNLSAHNTELNEQIQISSCQVALNKDEKQAIQTRLDKTLHQLKCSQDQEAQESVALSIQIRNLSEELEAREASIQDLETQLVVANYENAAIKESFNAERARLTQQVSALKTQFDTLGQTNAQLSQDLAALTSRHKQIDFVLATPIGRLFTLLQGFKWHTH